MKSLLTGILCLAILSGVIRCDILMGVDLNTQAINTGVIFYGNTIGLSMDLPQFIKVMNNSLFQGYVLNSNIYGNVFNNFLHNIHTPNGYVYNCTNAKAIDNTTNCTVELQGNTTFFSQIASYIKNICNRYALVMGWNVQGSTLSSAAYIASNLKPFYSNIYTLSKSQISIAVADYGDLVSDKGWKANYTFDSFLNDAVTTAAYMPGVAITGPGITQDADPSWLSQYPNFNDAIPFGWFSVRCVVFKNAVDLTIPNLLSDNYTRIYLQNRFTVSGTTFTDFSSYFLGLTDIRLIQGNGIDGVTNSFAAAIWALDFIFQAGLYSPFELAFYNPLTVGNFQSIFGSPPLFQPNSLFYGLLFGLMASSGQPTLILPTITGGSSSNLKAYGIQLYASYKVLIINKDMNTSMKGQVQLNIPYTSGIRCIYLQAPNMSSPSADITLGGMHFVSNNPDYVGDFTNVTYPADNITGIYLVNVSYAQSVLCETISFTINPNFPTGSSSHNYHYQCAIMIIFLIASLIL